MSVTIYSTPSCQYCNKAKDFFKEHSVDYKEVDVSTDSAAADEMVQKSGQMGVPVIVVENDGKEDIVVGFDEPKLKELLSV